MFREGGAAHFLDAPLHELSGRTLALDDVLPRGAIENALDAGYFDQSHFHRDFRLMTGDAPRRFFRNGDLC